MDNGLLPVEVCRQNFHKHVLILIVMDNGLLQHLARQPIDCQSVLILIVMDNGLLQAKKAEADYILSRLNPYCNG